MWDNCTMIVHILYYLYHSILIVVTSSECSRCGDITNYSHSIIQCDAQGCIETQWHDGPAFAALPSMCYQSSVYARLSASTSLSRVLTHICASEIRQIHAKFAIPIKL